MDKKKEKLHQLLNKSRWSPIEKMWMLDYLNANKGNTEELKDLMWDQFTSDTEIEDDQIDSDELLTKIYAKIEQRKGFPAKRSSRRQWLSVAAVTIGLIICSIYFFQYQAKNTASSAVTTLRKAQVDIIPGEEKAILIREDGSKMVLDGGVARPRTAVDPFTEIENGKITYNQNVSKGNAMQYNTITTPNSGHYQVVLPDGSKVWLNASSSIRFPTAFIGKERKVEIQGEVFFDVIKQEAKPFVVQVNDAEIRVLGTQFNVMAYRDEKSLKTTLIEGSVLFSNNVHEQVKLKPGQQSSLTANGRIAVLDNVNLANVLAWREGFFDFDGDDIESVTRQLARWYDVDIVMPKTSKDLFYARIPKNTMLPDVLKALELTGKVRFEISGRKINVII